MSLQRINNTPPFHLSSCKVVGKAGFTLAEVLTVAVIAMYIFAGAWGVFTIAWSWAHEIAPELEAQGIARKILAGIVDGKVSMKDTLGTSRYVAGSYTVDVTGAGSVTYWKRNGLTWATNADTASIPPKQDGVAGAQSVAFGLYVSENSNPRSFYRAYDAGNKTYTVYYQDAGNNLYEIASVKEPWTVDIRFWRRYDAGTGTIYDNVIDVAVTVEADIIGTRNVPRHINITYNDSVYLGNV